MLFVLGIVYFGLVVRTFWVWSGVGLPLSGTEGGAARNADQSTSWNTTANGAPNQAGDTPRTKALDAVAEHDDPRALDKEEEREGRSRVRSPLGGRGRGRGRGGSSSWWMGWSSREREKMAHELDESVEDQLRKARGGEADFEQGVGGGDTAPTGDVRSVDRPGDDLGSRGSALGVSLHG